MTTATTTTTTTTTTMEVEYYSPLVGGRYTEKGLQPARPLPVESNCDFLTHIFTWIIIICLSSRCYFSFNGRVSEADDDTMTPAAESCPSLAGCTLMCVRGYLRQSDGCYVCQCIEPERGQFRQLVQAHSFTFLACVPAARWLRGTEVRTSVFGRRTCPVLRSTCRWRVTTYVCKPSAIGPPTRPTNAFHPFEVDKLVVSCN